MNFRAAALCLVPAAVISGLFSISLHGCGWSSNEMFAAAVFFAVAIGVSILTFALAKEWWVVLFGVLIAPLLAACLYSLLMLFSPGNLSAGPCVERSTWTAFSALYLAASSSALLNRSLWQKRAVAAVVAVIAIAAAVLLLRNVF